MNEKHRKLIGFGLLILALIVMLVKKNEIERPPRYYAWEIHMQTGRILAEEFGFKFPKEEFDVISNPEKSIPIGENKWKLKGDRILSGRLLKWTALVEYVPSAPTAILLKLELDGEVIFPTTTQSNLVFETNYVLRL